jgi:L-histidine Nalpha-methyltransferase
MRAVAEPLGNRFDVLGVLGSPGASFADDVASAWGRNPKRRIPPKYFYDERGSTLFEAITQLPDYYLGRAETEIIAVNGRHIVNAFGAPLELLELGSGSALKTRLLIDAILRVQSTLHFSALDVCRGELEKSSYELVDTFPRLFVHAYAGDYFDVLGSRALQFGHAQKVLALCLGSNLGNYDAAGAQHLMASLSALLGPGDGVLMGLDTKKDHKTLERAYNDQGGLMREFATNVLTRMNRELGASFNPSDFDLVAQYDEERGSVDSFLRSRRTHDVTIEKSRITVHFDEEELVPTESSYKYDSDDVARLAIRNGFKMTNVWHDKAHSFASYLLLRDYAIERTTPPSTRIAEPVVPDAAGVQR